MKADTPGAAVGDGAAPLEQKCTPEEFAAQQQQEAGAWEIHNLGLAQGKAFAYERIGSLVAKWRKEAQVWLHGIGENQNTRLLNECADQLEQLAAVSRVPPQWCVACEKGDHQQCLGGRCECIHSSRVGRAGPDLAKQWRATAEALIEDVNNGQAPTHEADFARGMLSCADELSRVARGIASAEQE